MKQKANNCLSIQKYSSFFKINNKDIISNIRDLLKHKGNARHLCKVLLLLLLKPTIETHLQSDAALINK